MMGMPLIVLTLQLAIGLQHGTEDLFSCVQEQTSIALHRRRLHLSSPTTLAQHSHGQNRFVNHLGGFD